MTDPIDAVETKGEASPATPDGYQAGSAREEQGNGTAAEREPGGGRRKALDAVSALLDERGRYEAWLTTLETRRASTPEHVYGRVRADYEGRLQRVMEQLSGFSTDLRDAISELDERIGRLEREETQRRDEKYEGELRAAVGEYEPGKWEELRRECDDVIERLSGERSAASAELARLHDILGLAERPVTPPDAPAVATVAVVEEPSEAVVAATNESPTVAESAEPYEPPEPPPVPVAPTEIEPEPERVSASATVGRGVETPPVPAFDELEFLKSIVGPRASEAQGQVSQSSGGTSAGSGGIPAASSPRPFAPRPAPPRPGAVTPPRSPAVTSPPAPTHRATSPGRPAHPGGDVDRGSILDAGRGFEAPAASEPVRPAERPAEPPAEAPAETRPRSSSQISDGLRRFSLDRGAPPTTPTFLKETTQDQAKTLQCQECGTMNYPTEWYCERCGGELAAM